jgi:hypothetical protein
MVVATFWEILTQTHLVTLLMDERLGLQTWVLHPLQIKIAAARNVFQQSQIHRLRPVYTKHNLLVV